MIDIQAISLEFSVLVVGLVMLMFEAFLPGRDRRQFAYAGAVALWVVFVFSCLVNPAESGATFGLYATDSVALFYKQLALLTTAFVLLMSVDYIPVIRKFIPSSNDQAGLGEFFSIPVLACAGLMWMASANDFILIFVSLELVTVSSYVLVSYLRRSSGSLEAGVKYLILGALSTGFLVYGITWIYGATGKTNLDEIGAVLQSGQFNETAALFGLLLVMVALGFKVAAVPFHFWVPDVYQGAPTPVTAFLSVGSKAAGFVVLLRVLEPFLASSLGAKVGMILMVLAILTLLFGNLAALPQRNFKRLLAYSSIAHAGFLLAALAAAYGPADNIFPGVTISYYLAGYMIMTLLAFTIMIIVANQMKGDDLADFNGLAKRSPFAAGMMLVSAISLAGVPLTVGFFGKFLVLKATLTQHLWLLSGVVIFAAACGFYYYLKVVRAMYWQAPADETPVQIPTPSKIAMSVLAVLVFVLGIFPEPVMALLN